MQVSFVSCEYHCNPSKVIFVREMSERGVWVAHLSWSPWITRRSINKCPAGFHESSVSMDLLLLQCMKFRPHSNKACIWISRILSVKHIINFIFSNHNKDPTAECLRKNRGFCLCQEVGLNPGEINHAQVNALSREFLRDNKITQWGTMAIWLAQETCWWHLATVDVDDHKHQFQLNRICTTHDSRVLALAWNWAESFTADFFSCKCAVFVPFGRKWCFSNARNIDDRSTGSTSPKQLGPRRVKHGKVNHSEDTFLTCAVFMGAEN